MLNNDVQVSESEPTEEETTEGTFVLKRKTNLSDLHEGNTILPESDLTIQTKDALFQYSYKEPKKKERKFNIEPGCFMLTETSMGIILKDFELRKYELLESVDNTHSILSEANKFFGRLHVYKELEREPKRALLLASPPGVGKTAAINKVCETFLKEEGTVVVVWDTSAIKSSSVNRFFLQGCEFTDKVKKMVFIMEDIGGGSIEDYGGARGADSSLLNLLDGVGTPFKGVPTFIIATTNNPEQSVGALIDRPGRFDKVTLMDTPTEKECIELLQFISKKETLNDDDIEAAKLAAKEKFSIAHIQEIIVRSRLDDISTLESAKQLCEHKSKHKKGFSNTQSLGFGLS